MHIRSLRGPGLIALGRLQEALGQRMGRLDWRLAGLLRQAQGRLITVQTRGELPPSWHEARP